MMGNPIITKLPKRNKYGARKSVYNGVTYDSIAEADHARFLDLFSHSDIPKYRVVNIERQYPFELAGGIVYRVDFRVTCADGHVEYHEVKGHATPEFKLKMKLMKEKYPDVEIRIFNARKH